MGLLIDTNVISELRKGTRCDARVAQWQADVTDLQYISVITLLEIRHGIQRARPNDPDFAAKLDDWYYQKVKPRFSGRTLAVDIEVAERCAVLGIDRNRPYADALIAATALVHGLSIVTRNVDDFVDTGAVVINPWEAN